METQIFHITIFVSTAGINHFCKTILLLFYLKESQVKILFQNCILVKLAFITLGISFTLMLTKTISDSKF